MTKRIPPVVLPGLLCFNRHSASLCLGECLTRTPAHAPGERGGCPRIAWHPRHLG
jgi:hypothetical protein